MTVTVLRSQLWRESLMVTGSVFHSVTSSPLHEVKADVVGELNTLSAVNIIKSINNIVVN